MMYLAPRQGLFAIIILVSFFLHTLLLVISTDQQLTKSRALKGEQMVAQLIDEARLSLENKDRVSLSVIANRYTSEQDVARIVIRDSDDNLLVPVGNAPLQQGNTIRQIATQGDAVIGSVALTLKDLSKGEIIAMQWPFVVGSLIFHLFLWLLYGYIARPTKEQINALSRDIQDMQREQLPKVAQYDYEQQLAQSDAMTKDSVDSAETYKTSRVDTAAIHDELNAYLKSQQSSSAVSSSEAFDDNISGTDSSIVSSKTPLERQGTQAKGYHASDSASTTTTVRPSGTRVADGESSSTADSNSTDPISAYKFTSSASKLSTQRDFDTVNVQIKFHDEYDMLERLAPEMRTPYLALCTQLLNQAVNELLEQPLLQGVSVINQARFDIKGAWVELKADNEHAKVALAGVMLGKLYLMLNKIIHDKHIELSRFALPVKVGVSDEAQANAMAQLLSSVGRKEQMLILLPNAGLKQIGNHVQVRSLKRPTTVYERECAVFEGGSDAIIQRLVAVRNAVLMTGHESELSE